MISRRTMLGGGLAAGAAPLAGCWVSNAQTGFSAPLPIPELIDARRRNGALSLTAAEGRHAFVAGKPARTYGFSAPYLGPTLRVHSGDEVEVTVENRLDVVTTAHWHGLLVPAAVDGGPHLRIAPGGVWRPRLKVAQPETTTWYHAHPHHDTGRQVYMGLAGMMIIEDGSGERLGLPRTYGVDDLPLILQDRQLNAEGGLVYAAFGPSMMGGMRGETLMVNGAVRPVAKVPRGLVRLRVLNGANARNFDLSFSDGRSFQVIASDGGYLPAPVAMTALTVSPSERFEILVDFSDGKAVVLQTGPDRRMFMGGRGMQAMASSAGGEIMRFEVDRSRLASVRAAPRSLVPLAAADPGKAVARRTLTLDMGMGMGGGMGMGRGGMGRGGMGMGMFGINGRAFDMGRIDLEPRLGSTEIWTVTPGMMAHPFHVHGVIFRVLSLGGNTPPPHLAGGKDTILLEDTAELLMSFTQPATRESPFMFHCHILEHEDAGLMGQYRTLGA